MSEKSRFPGPYSTNGNILLKDGEPYSTKKTKQYAELMASMLNRDLIHREAEAVAIVNGLTPNAAHERLKEMELALRTLMEEGGLAIPDSRASEYTFSPGATMARKLVKFEDNQESR